MVISETTVGSDYLTLVQNSGCSVQDFGEESDLSCAIGDVAAQSESPGAVIAWQVDADAPDGMSLLHFGEVTANSATYTESSNLDNVADLEVTVVRQSDLVLDVQSEEALAGESFMIEAVVTNLGPSFSDNTMVDFYLPAGVALESASPGCAQDADLVS